MNVLVMSLRKMLELLFVYFAVWVQLLVCSIGVQSPNRGSPSC
jgi:hypothetical protein